MRHTKNVVVCALQKLWEKWAFGYFIRNFVFG